MTTGDTLPKSETITVAIVEDDVPLLVQACEIIAAFEAMIRKKSQADLDAWLERAERASLDRSPPGSPRTGPPSAPQSLCHGPPAKPRARSPSSSS